MKWMIALLLLLTALGSQAQRQITIEQADELKFKKTGSDQIQRLLGNVILSHDSVILYCDSAYFYSTKNYFFAYGNVRMLRGEMDLRSDSLWYNGNSRNGRAIGQVRFMQEEMLLTTDLLTFSRRDQQIQYYTGANIQQEDGHLYSRKGTYFTERALFYFSDSVRILQEDYTIETDSMHHWKDLEVSMFFGPTTIVTDSQVVNCGFGWFDGKTESIRAGKGVTALGAGRLLRSDSLYFDGVTETMYAWRKVFLADTNKSMRISTPHLRYNEKGSSGYAGPDPIVARLEEGDSIYFQADHIYVDSTLEEGVFINAFHDVKVYRVDLQARCDSLVYIESDSIIELFKAPIMWSEFTQVTGESIRIYLKNEEPDRLEVVNNCFLLAQEAPMQYNQLKGKYMLGHFREGYLRKIKVLGNGESIYFARDEDQALMGINKVICSDLNVWLQNGEVDRIQFLTKPEGSLFPQNDLIGGDRELRGFEDRFVERPTDPYKLRDTN